MTHKHLSNSTLSAAAILSAWRENNLEQLDRNLADASVLHAEPTTSPYESERLDLLGGIAVEMRRMMASGQIPEAAVYIPLLDHLASHVMRPPDCALIC
jgi:hypothetical protein